MTTVLFVHHSIGRQILAAGLRSMLAAGPEPIAVWDHDYNDIGLSGPDGERIGVSFPVPDDDTDPAGLVTFVEALAAGTLERVPDHDVLVVKSCFPNSAIASDAALAEVQDVYRRLRVVAGEVPAHVVLASSPPLVVEATDRGQAARAIALREWLADDWPGDGRSFVDLHAALSYASGPLRGTLRTGYRVARRGDSHLGPRGARAGAEALTTAIRTASREHSREG